MARELRWTRSALARLDVIATYIAQDNPVRATSFVRELPRQAGAAATVRTMPPRPRLWHPGFGTAQALHRGVLGARRRGVHPHRAAHRATTGWRSGS